MPITNTIKTSTYRYWNGEAWQGVYFTTSTDQVVELTGTSKKFITPSQISKLSGIAANAQVNVIETVKVNGSALAVTSKAVDIDLSGYVPVNRMVNGKALSNEVVLYATDINLSSSDSTTILTKITSIQSALNSHGSSIGDYGTRLMALENVINSAGTSDADSVINKLNEVFTFLENTEEGTNFVTALAGKVPTSRTINGKALTSNITLSAADVGAATSGHTHSDYVPTTRTINSKPLSGNILLNGTDIIVAGDINGYCNDKSVCYAINSLHDETITTRSTANSKCKMYVQSTEPTQGLNTNDVWIEIAA